MLKWILGIVVFLIVVGLILYFGLGIGKANPSNSSHSIQLTPSQCVDDCDSQCKASHPGLLFTGRNKCRKACISDCEAGLDISGY